MMRRQVGAIAVLVVCCWLFLVAPTAGLGAETPVQVNNTTDTPNVSFGQQVSSFMQASAVDANASVERGMWQASVNRTVDERGDPTAKVTNRIARLERTLQHLRNRSQRLADTRDRLPSVAYTARASALREQIANLQADIDATERTATRSGLNTSRLHRLRSLTENTTGPDIAAAARSITDAPRGPPATVPGRGQPEDTGPEAGGPPEDAGSGEAEPGENEPPGSVGPRENRTVTAGGQTPADADDTARGGSTGDEGQDGDEGETDNRGGDESDDTRGEPGGNGGAADDDVGDSPDDPGGRAGTGGRGR